MTPSSVPVSVVTPTTGRRHGMLLEAVASVHRQTQSPLEHIVVDDGSFSVPGLDGVTLAHTEGVGPGPARNKAIGLASGAAVAFLDDDDIWHPHHLSTVWETMQRTDADVVYADCIVENRRDGYGFEVADFDGDRLMRENFICLPATLVRTSALRDVGGFPAEAREEDWSLWKLMHRAGKRFVHVPVVSVTYRFHTDNITYGGADPDRTRADKLLREAAERGELSWTEYEERSAEVWS